MCKCEQTAAKQMIPDTSVGRFLSFCLSFFVVVVVVLFVDNRRIVLW